MKTAFLSLFFFLPAILPAQTPTIDWSYYTGAPAFGSAAAADLDKDGNPIEGLPDAGGYLELVLPSDLLQDQPRSFQLEWIDFYRN